MPTRHQQFGTAVLITPREQGTMYQTSARTGVHRARYRDLAKTSLLHQFNAAAITL